jgi:hypothetical protein
MTARKTAVGAGAPTASRPRPSVFSRGLVRNTEAGFHAMNAALKERLTTTTVGTSER